MINKNLALFATLLLAAGCAQRGSEQRVTMRDEGPNYTGTTYSETTQTIPANTAVASENDNSSKGAGARALTGNQDNTTIESTGPSGGAVVIGEGENQSSKGAGARALTGEPPATIQENSTVVVTTTDAGVATDAGTPNTKGEGARALTGANESGDIAQGDAAFVRAAGEAGLAEVKMGQVAQQNAENQAIKDFGQRLVTDHSKANEELAQIASQKGFQVPTVMGAKDEAMIQHLSSLNGAEFDKACGRHAVEAHQKAIRLFKTEAQSGQDAELKAFAQKTLPTLEEHLRMAKQLNSSTKGE
jgi:putative membrane protein